MSLFKQLLATIWTYH